MRQYAIMLMTLCLAAGAQAGSSVVTTLDALPSPRTAKETEEIRHSNEWVPSGDTAKVFISGREVMSLAGDGAYYWTPSSNGTYVLEHKVLNAASAQIGSTLTATFNVADKRWHVTFDANGIAASGMPEPQTVAAGEKAKRPTSDPTALAYRFTGWCVAADCKTAFSFENTAITNATTLYARWTPIVYSIGYTLDGGSLAAANPTNYTVDSESITLVCPTRTGYIFAGWTGTGLSEPTKTVTLPKGTIGERTYTATWVENPGLRLWKNGPYWARNNVGASAPEEYGYYFWWGGTTGYKRNAAGNGWVSVKDGSPFSFSAANCPTYNAGDAALRAAGYLDAGGKLAAAHDAARAHSDGAWRTPIGVELAALVANCTVAWTTRGGVPGQLVTGSGAYSTNSIFLPAAGYGDGSAHSNVGTFGLYWSATPYSDYSHDAFQLYLSSTEFTQYHFARFSGQSVRPVIGEILTLTLTKGAGISNLYVTVAGTKSAYSALQPFYDGTTVEISADVKVGYEAYAGDVVTMSESVTKTISTTPTTYPITYALDGGAAAGNPTNYTIESSPVTLVNPTKAGHTFAGWKGTGLSAPTLAVTIPTGSIGSRAYTATWTIDSYPVSFAANGKTSEMPPAQTVPYGSTAKRPTADPTAEGYTFNGWYATVASTAAFDFAATPITRATTLYAGWTPVSYAITYDLDGGTASNPDSYTIEQMILLNNPTRDNHTFTGWTGTELVAPSTSVTIPKGSTGSRAYKATWTVNSYTVTFSANGKPATMPPSQTVERDMTAHRPESDPKAAGYDFTGWYVSSACTRAYEFTNAVTKTTVIYAGWTPVTYSLACDLNGGSLDGATPENPVSFTVESDAITLGNPVRKGYVFAGWTGTGLDAATRTVTIPHGSLSNRTYTATWQEVSGVRLWAHGPVWAKCNVGASAPEEHGYHFWWGDTAGYRRKAGYDGWVSANDGTTFQFASTNCPTSAKDLPALEAAGYADASGVLAADYDAARAHFGGSWRMPTDAELSALASNCTTRWTTQNGVRGRLVTGKGSYIAQSIFLPAAGCGSGSDLLQADARGDYWSATAKSNDTGNAWCGGFDASAFARGDRARSAGLCVRAVSGSVLTLTKGAGVSQLYVTVEGTKTVYDAAMTFDVGTAVAVSADVLPGYGAYAGETVTMSEHVARTIATTAVTYAIAYELDGGAVATANPTAYTVESAPFTLANPTKTGCTFAGWTGTGLTAATTNVTVATGSTGDRSYVATWTVNRYAVSFDANGRAATGLPPAQAVEHGGTATWPTSDPTVPGYRFTGWYAAADCRTPFDFARTAITRDTTVYAGWVLDVAVTAKVALQRYPWNGLMDIAVTLRGTQAAVAKTRCTFAATNNVTGAGVTMRSVVRNGAVTGSDATWTRRYIWDAGADLGQVKIDNLAIFIDVEEEGARLWDNGPVWAKCNVGAATAEESGYYFWWGDTVGYKRNAAGTGWVSAQDGSAFAFTAANCPTYGKNVAALKSAGYTDTTGTLVPAHDAARAHCGGTWRMPTDAELQGLATNCTATWTTQNGVVGRLVSGRGAYASESIFLPAAGYGEGSDLKNAGSYGDYWSASANRNDSFGAWYHYLNLDTLARSSRSRTDGLTIRPVLGSVLTLTKGNGISKLYVKVGGASKVPYASPLTVDEGTTVAISADVLPGYAAYAGESVIMSDFVTKTISATPITYAISYTLDGGTVSTPNPATYTIESAAITLVNPTKSGYTFAGWKGTGITGISMSVTIPTGTTGERKYTATWTRDTYTITYDLDGGTLATANPGTYTVGTATFTLVNPTRDGHSFAGWKGTDISGTSKSVTIAKGSTGNREYTATWEDVPGVRLWANGPYWATWNVGASKPEEYGYYFRWGDTAGCRRNAAGDGWVSVADGSDATFAAGACPAHGKDDAALRSAGYLDAHGFLTAAHDAARACFGGAWRMPTKTELAALQGNCTAAWKTQDGVLGRLVTGKGDYATKSIFLPAAGYGDGSDLKNAASGGFYWSSVPVPEYANYAYDLRFESASLYQSNDTRYRGQVVRPVRGNVLTLTKGAGIATLYATIGGTKYAYSAPLTLDAGTAVALSADVKAGYAAYAGESVTMSSHVTKTVSASTLAYTISYTLNGGAVATANPTSYNVESAPITLVNPTKAGYSFAGWEGTGLSAATKEVTIATGSTGERKYTATWKAVEYPITCNLNGGTASPANPTKYTIETATFTLVNPTKDGYTFAGWKGTGITGTSPSVTVAKGTTGERTYTATWTAVSYSLAYTLNGGTVATQNKTSYTIETATFTLVNPTKDGYTFAGWDGTGLGGPSTSVTIAKGSTGDRSYVATWSTVGYTITCDLKGGTVSTPNPTTYTAESGPITLVNPTKKGYTFAGWTGTGITGTAQTVTIPTGSTGPRSYEATWTLVSYSLSYTLNGGAVSTSNPSKYTVESPAIKLVNPTKNGYTFTGWTGPEITDKSTSVTIATGSTGHRTYAATWTPTAYKITYTLGGGTATPANPESYTIESADFTLTAPTRAGYDFAGWKGTGITGTATSVTIAKGSIGERAYTAQWTRLTYKLTCDLQGGAVATANPASYNVETASFTLVNPTKTGYSFAGWTGTGLSAATKTVTIKKGSVGDRSYTATWDSVSGVQLWAYGPVWAIQNVGATAPEEYGFYFWWGDTVGYKRNAAGNGWVSAQDGTSFTFTTANCPTYGKSNSALKSAGYTDANGTLVAAHDAARAHFGGAWRMPTDSELTALLSNCTADWKTQNGVAGRLVTGKGDYATKSIFLPAAGYADGSSLSQSGSYGDYWSATAKSDNSNNAWNHYFNSTEFTRFNYARNAGQSVRPVRGYVLTLTKGTGISKLYVTVGGTKSAYAAALTLDPGTEVTLSADVATGYKTYADETVKMSDHVTKTVSTTLATYSLTYDLAGGSVSTANKTTYTYETATFTLNNPTKSGYTFAGWKGTGIGETAQKTVTVAKGSTGNRTYTATWTRDTYTITYTLDGGTVATPNPTSYNVESAAITLVNPTKTGYTFAGWKGTGIDGTSSSVTIAKGSTENRTYTATWTRDTYTITYTLDGGTVATPNPATYTIETATFTLVNPTKTGYTFAGWKGTGIDETLNTVKIPKGSTGNRSYTATWTINSYTVSFNANGKTSTMPSSQKVTYGSKATTPATPTATGYTFRGWYTTSDGATAFDFANTAITKDTTIYAGWTPVSYKITCNLDGGTASNPTSYTIESADITLVNPTKDSYTFAGWTGGGHSDPTMSVTIPAGSTGDRIYTATWMTFGYTITYNLAGGTASGNPAVYNVETPTFTLNQPTRTGYTFAGWTGTGIGETAQKTVTVAKGSTGNRTYTATWTRDTYTITYTLDGGAVATANPTKYTVTTTSFTLLNPTKTGYTFAGWTGTGLSAATKTVTIKKGSVGNRSYKATWDDVSGVQLWAYGPVWATQNVGASAPEDCGFYFWWGDTVGYRRNAANTGWVSAKDGTAFEFTTANCPTYGKTVSALKSAGYTDANGTLVAAHDAARAHFSGAWRMPTDSELTALLNNCTAKWSTTNGVAGRLVTGKGTYATKSIFLPAGGYGEGSSHLQSGTYGDYWSATAKSDNSNNAWNYYFNSSEFTRFNYARNAGQSVRAVRGYVLTLTKGTGISKLYATVGGTKITYSAPLTFDPGTAVKLSADPATGYQAYAGETVTMSDHVTKTVSATPITYTLTYNLAGGSVSTANPATYTVDTAAFTLVNPTKDGYTFAGWEGGGLSEATKEVTIAKGSTGNRTYTATWTPIIYSITYELNGGTAASGNPATYTIESAAITLNNPTKDGYAFAGWEGGGLSGATVSVTIPKGSIGNRTYKATWTTSGYTLTYVLNGGTVSPANPATYTIETASFTLNNPTKTGYTFKGWTRDGLSTATKTVTIAKGSTGNRTYTANWTINSYTVSFNANGKTSTMPSSQSVNYNATATTPTETPTATGYSFKGWYTTSDCATPFNFTTTKITKATTVYAGWTPVSYTITYTLNNGTVVGNPATYTIETASFTLVNPTRTGYAFAGWKGTGIGETAQKTVTVAKGSTENRSYTATWTALSGVQLWANGPVWSTLNVGAAAPEDYGFYFWWGGTVGYRRNAANTGWVSAKDGTAFEFTAANCPTSGKSNSALQSAGYTDANGTLVAAHDAARTYFGGAWRMPTYSELSALVANCTATWTTQNGVAGRLVTGKGTYATKSIFLPAAGYGDGSSLSQAGTDGYCFSATAYSGDAERVSCLHLSSSDFLQSYCYRRTAKSVRPVRGYVLTLTKGTGISTLYVTVNGTKSTYSAPLTFEPGTEVTLSADAATGYQAYLGETVVMSDHVTKAISSTLVTYTLTYVLDGGTVATANPANYTYETASFTLNNPTRTGYTFKGWTGDGLSTATKTVTIAKGSTGNRTYTANWTINSYTVSFNPNGKTSTMPSSQSVNYNATATKPTDTPTTTGYTFKGWYTSSDCATVFDFTNTKITKATTVYAGWTINSYTVSFNANGKTATMPSSQSVNYNATATKPSAPTATGYTFKGWYTSSDCATAFDFTNTKITQATTIYAGWTLASYTLTYELNGGTVSPANPATYTIETAAFTLVKPMKTGYIFTGWTGGGLTAATKTVKIAKGSTENRTYTATWRENTGVQLWEGGPCWSEINVGAACEEDYGYYFWWGGTVGYKRNAADTGWVSVQDGTAFEFNAANCPTYNKTDSALQSAGYTDANGTLVAAHDAATEHLGAPWRMPTYAEIEALYDGSICDWITTQRNGVSGCLVRGRGEYASKSIFLPFTGYGSDSSLCDPASGGRCWSSTPRSGYSGIAKSLHWFSYGRGLGYDDRYYGLSVRPVRAITYTITYDLDGGTVATANPATYTVDTAAFTLVNPTKDGYTFAGWTGTGLSAASTSVTIPKGSTGNRTYTATWRKDGVQLWEGGPYWSETNVGAQEPEDYGYYFWWGDTVGYRRNAANTGWVSVQDGTAFEFNAANCPTYGKTVSALQSAGYTDANGTLVAAHDAARTYFGAPWRMPTHSEFLAIFSNCDWIWTQRNGVSGHLVTGLGEYASKSIFLPAAGHGSGSGLDQAGSGGHYWSSTPYSVNSYCAGALYFSSGHFTLSYYDRYYGLSVRPVR